MTKDKFFERFAGWITFFVVLVGMSFVSLDYYDFREIINATPEVSISIFGILLAFMGIILQSPNDTIKAMLANDNNYKTFMSFGSRVELNSAILKEIAFTGRSKSLTGIFLWQKNRVIPITC